MYSPNQANGFIIRIFHGGLVEPSKKEAYEIFKNHPGPVIVLATTSFGTGVDVRNLVLVVFIGAPRSMLDFVQGSGRGARSKHEEAVSLTISNSANREAMLQMTKSGVPNYALQMKRDANLKFRMHSTEFMIQFLESRSKPRITTLI